MQFWWRGAVRVERGEIEEKINKKNPKKKTKLAKKHVTNRGRIGPIKMIIRGGRRQ